MARPKDIGVIDLMIGFPSAGRRDAYHFPGLKDSGSKSMTMPAEYMFGDVPDDVGEAETAIASTIEAMDTHGVDQGLFSLNEVSVHAHSLHPDRVRFVAEFDPHKGTVELQRLRDLHAAHDLSAISVFQSGLFPQRSIADPAMYPFHALAVDLDVPLMANAGVAGPRFPSEVQHVRHVDDVCYDFPDLRLVMRHGGEPWQALAVKLMLKWPNLGYATSAFAPKHYPAELIDFANTRGADQVMYAGYFPMGLELSRIFSELDAVAFRDETWPKFLRTNAERIFKL